MNECPAAAELKKSSQQLLVSSRLLQQMNQDLLKSNHIFSSLCIEADTSLPKYILAVNSTESGCRLPRIGQQRRYYQTSSDILCSVLISINLSH